MATNFILFILLFGVALVCQCSKISTEDSLSLMDLLSKFCVPKMFFFHLESHTDVIFINE